MLKRSKNGHLIFLLVVNLVTLASARAQPQHPPAEAPPPDHPAIEPVALEMLQTMSKRLAAAKSMDFTAVTTYESPARNGQPLYYSTLSQVTLQRPNKLRVVTPGDGPASDFYYNGKSMMAYTPGANLVADDGTTSGGTHYATTSRGGTAVAKNGSWAATGANGHTDSGSYGTTAYGTHYATGSYGGAVATNNGHWAAAGGNGGYACGTHYGGTTAYGGAYHPPAVVNQYYGTGCYNCGGWSGGAVAAAGVAGLAVGAAAGAAVANANAAAAYTQGNVYAALPAGCTYSTYYGTAYYGCNGTWFSPAYGANGLYYRVVPPP